MSQSLILHNWENEKGIKQMSDEWLREKQGKRILQAVNVIED